MNAIDEDKRDERLAGLMAGMLGSDGKGGVLQLASDQRLRRRLPMAIALAAATTLAVLLIVGAGLYLRYAPPADSVAQPVVQPLPQTQPSPRAFVAIAPPPPSPAAPVRRRHVAPPVIEARHAAAPRPDLAPRSPEFAPTEEAYGPYPAVPLSAEALRRVLVDDRRRTRELNNRELGNLQGP